MVPPEWEEDKRDAPTAYGTAFTTDVDGRQYLITAKHVVASIDTAMRVGIDVQRKSGWFPLQVIVYKCDDPFDIAVLIPSVQLTVDLPLTPIQDFPARHSPIAQSARVGPLLMSPA